MRGPRMRDRSDGAAVCCGETVCCPAGGGSFTAAKAAFCSPFVLRTALRVRPDCFAGRGFIFTPFTSARKRAIVSMLTDTSTVASNSRISRRDAPFSRSSTMPSFSGISFAYRFGGGGVNARTASRKRCVRTAMSVRSLILLAGVQRQVGFRSMATG